MRKFTTTFLTCLLTVPAFAFTPESVCNPGAMMLPSPQDGREDIEAVKRPAPTRADDGIITEAPEGKTVSYSLGGYSFINSYGRVSYSYSYGYAREVVFTDDAMYLLNPLTGLASNTYLKASKIDDTTYEAALPVPIYSEVDGEGNVYVYDLAMMDVVPLEGGGVTYEANDESSVTFKVEDGSIYLDLGYVNTPDPDTNYPSFPDKILGMAFDGKWAGNGEAQQTWTPFNPVVATPPSDMQTERWAMTYEDNATFVNVGFDGDTVWIGGLYVYMPELWIYGKVMGDKIRIESNQYALTQYGMYYCFNNCITSESKNTLVDYYDYEYDAEAKSIRPADPAMAIILCSGKDPYYYYSAIWVNPLLRLQPEDIDQTPLDPYDMAIWGSQSNMLDFQLPYLNKDGYLLDTSKMYYQVRYDGDVETFFEEDYPDDGFVGEMTDIPFTWSSINFNSYGTFHTLRIVPLWLNTVGIQLFNEAPDGEVYKSNIVTYDLLTGEITTGVKQVTDAKPVSRIVYYTIDGMEICNPGEGVFIQKKIYEDGTCQIRKIARRN